MTILPPLPGPPLLPVPDPRGRNIVLDYADMHALVADLVLPDGASMYVTSALEASRELLRHSYYQYEFATAAVTHSLFALEHVLAERLAVDEPLQHLIERAADTGLITSRLATELDRSRLLRDQLTQGTASSAALGQAQGVALVGAVFAAVGLLLHSPAAATATATATMTAAHRSGAAPEERLAALWQDHRRALYPDGFRGVNIGSVELILVDADAAGLVHRELHGGLDDDGIAALWACIADLDRIVPLITSAYCAGYFAQLRTLARLAAAHHLPTAI
ncbi:hypothetical protein ABZ721_31860 [Streptomyces sp. NPDC006733]|uniref:hypothetical protein n=1 Tax=Streptomyces sp. NPDC006733 TaxID=3155460 RepID=UPI0033D52B0C